MRPPSLRARSASWWKRWFPLLACLGLLALAPVLAHSQEADSVVVSWTAPGDDGRVGTASSYDLRISLAPITDVTFDEATPVTDLPAPAPSGSRQGVTVRGLARGTTYYFALRTLDDAGNRSAISNLLRWDWTIDTAPPSAPSGVSARRDGDDARITWAANVEADLNGYIVYRAESEAGPYTPLNASPMAATEILDSALPDAAAVWYRVTAVDAAGNESARSAAASLTLQAQTAPVQAAIEPGYPNPSSASSPVHIPVVLNGEGHAVVDVLDSGGRRVRRIELSDLGAGRQEVVWDGRNDAGRIVAPGVYRAWLIAGGERSSIRLVRTP